MSGELALDSSTAIRYLNGDSAVVSKITPRLAIFLPIPVVGELLFGAENSGRSVENFALYLQFIDACQIVTIGRETAVIYSRTRHALKLKGRPIPENDIWIAAQCFEHNWTLITDDQHFTYVDGLAIERW